MLGKGSVGNVSASILFVNGAFQGNSQLSFYYCDKMPELPNLQKEAYLTPVVEVRVNGQLTPQHRAPDDAVIRIDTHGRVKLHTASAREPKDGAGVLQFPLRVHT